MQNKKNMPGHVLRELHRLLERNKKHAQKKKHTHTHRTKKHAEQKKNTLTRIIQSLVKEGLNSRDPALHLRINLQSTVRRRQKRGHLGKIVLASSWADRSALK